MVVDECKEAQTQRKPALCPRFKDSGALHTHINTHAPVVEGLHGAGEPQYVLPVQRTELLAVGNEAVPERAVWPPCLVPVLQQR